MPQCSLCNGSFSIDANDRKFYAQLDVPDPVDCPDCRQQKRIAWRNERNMYKRQCDCTGESIISMYPPDSPFKVYQQDVWWSDKWDALEYGREFDFSRPFFEQFRELQLQVPRLALVNKQSENSQYTNHAGQNKNCYMSGCIFSSENVHYSDWIMSMHDSIDCSYIVENCELCYEVYYAWNSYNAFYCDFIRSCSDIWFCYDCTNCKDCFQCWNLRNKQYCVENKQLTKEEYEQYMSSVLPMKHTDRDALRKKYIEIKNAIALRPGSYQMQTENCTGDLLFSGKNSFDCFDCINMEDCRYCIDAIDLKNSMDMYHVGWSELMYECHAMTNGYKCLCSHFAYDNQYVSYCDCTQNSKYLFGCCSMNQKRYCILNKQYTQKEYEELVPKIIAHMKQTGEYGQFFPIEFSPFAYNQSRAQEYFPLTKQEAEKRGIPWSDYGPAPPEATKTIPASGLPELSTETPEDVLDWAIVCEETEKPFKVIQQEYDFYQKTQLPLPRRHPDQRFDDRMAQRPPRKMWDRNCTQCNTAIQASYPPKSPTKVVCDKCYKEAVY